MVEDFGWTEVRRTGAKPGPRPQHPPAEEGVRGRGPSAGSADRCMGRGDLSAVGPASLLDFAPIWAQRVRAEPTGDEILTPILDYTTDLDMQRGNFSFRAASVILSPIW